MFRDSALLRGLLIAAICVPVALFLGTQLATPDDRTSLFWIAIAFSLLLMPVLIRWHHSLLIVCMGLPFIAFFLPGHPSFAFLLGGISLFISIVNQTLSKERPFISCRAVALPLIFLTVVILITAELTGGIHGNAFGSKTLGASRYVAVFGAIMGYFALVAQPVPPKYAKTLAYCFVLSGAVAALHSLLLITGLNIPIVIAFFSDAINNGTGEASLVERYTGLEWAAEAFCGFMIMRFGIRGIFDLHHPWRWLSFIVAFSLGLFGGYRSFVVIFIILFAVQFYFEKLYRSRLFFVFVLAGILASALILPFSDRLPLSVQRSISFLPVQLSPVAREDAFQSLDWRIDVWRLVLAQDVPKYFSSGKATTLTARICI